MSYSTNFKDFLYKPFPDLGGGLGFFKLIALIGIFVTFFLYVFQPFGISEIESNKFLICLGFGSMTLVGTIAYEVTITRLLSWIGLRQNWTFGKWLINNVGLTFFIGLANFLFIRLAFFGYINWEFFPTMLYSTFMIGLIPFSIWGVISLIINEKKYQGIASEINNKKAIPLAVDSKIQKTILSIPSDQIRYVEALQNYLRIGYLSASGEFKEQVERATLKNVLEEAKDTTIIKCHRSFLVNKKSIIETSGNAQGLLLTLSDCSKEIPVSRSFVPNFR